MKKFIIFIITLDGILSLISFTLSGFVYGIMLLLLAVCLLKNKISISKAVVGMITAYIVSLVLSGDYLGIAVIVCIIPVIINVFGYSGW